MIEELSPEELSQLSMEDLKDLFLKTRSLIMELKRNKMNAVNIEIYNCYIHRAIQEKK